MALQDCTDDSVEEFVFLKSTGQLRHEKSQLCITADFPDVYNIPRVVLKPCSLLESQVIVQRWDVPFYLMPDFQRGEGYIKLGYGSHQFQALCLTIDGNDLALVQCTAANAVQFIVEAWSDPHRWATCGPENEKCICEGGEVRFGDPDQNEWTPGVPVKDDVVCKLEELRKISMEDPLLASTGLNSVVECECRHDNFVDGDGDESEAMRLDQAEMSEFFAEQRKMGNMKMLGGAGAGIVFGALLIYCTKRKKRDDAQWEEAEEEWEGEDWEEEELYEEYEEIEEEEEIGG